MTTKIERMIQRQRLKQFLLVPLLGMTIYAFLLAFLFAGLLAKIPNIKQAGEALRLLGLAHRGLFAMGITFCAVMRCRHPNPTLHQDFSSWLRTTPWHRGLDLPIKPVQLVWQDFVFVGILEGYAHIRLGAPWLENSGVFVAVYLLFQLAALALRKETRNYALAIAVGLSGALLFVPNTTAIAAACWASYGVAYLGLQRLLDVLPFEPEASPPRFTSYGYGLLGPWSATRTDGYLKLRLMLSLYPGWVAYCFIRGVSHIDKKGPELSDFRPSAIYGLFLLAAGIRLLVFVVQHWPPISLAGRIRTLRLIIPRYDCVFLAPIIISLLCFLPEFLFAHGYSAELTVALTISTTLAAMLFLPPSLRWWKLCGEHRIFHVIQGKGKADQESSFAELLWSTWRPERVLLIPSWAIALATVCFFLAAKDEKPSLSTIKVAIFVAIFHALFRSLYALPLPETPYGRWLKTTPWRAAQTLPLGPLPLCWQDFLTLAIFETLALYFYPRFPSGLIVAGFLCVHLLISSILLGERQRVISAILRLGVPTVLIFLPGMAWKLAGFCALAIIAQLGIRKWLRDRIRAEFEAPAPPKFDPGIFGLGYREPRAKLRVETLAALSLCVYGVFCLCAALANPIIFSANELERIQWPIAFTLAFALWYPLLKYLFGYGAPLNLSWRLRHGLIIPAYDKIFIPPLLLNSIILLGPPLLEEMGFSIPVAVSFATFAVLAANQHVWPPFREWQLTGFHAINLRSLDTSRKTPAPKLTVK